LPDGCHWQIVGTMTARKGFPMNVLFAPAVAVMNRLRYPKKFALLGLVALVAIISLQTMLYRELTNVIEPSRRELAGLEVVEVLNKLVGAIQQHRGLSSGVLNGNEALKERRAGKEKDVIAALASVAPRIDAGHASGIRWTKVTEEWTEILKDGMEWTSTENFARHTAMIGNALLLIIDVADESSLTLDPDIDSYYLMDTIVVKMPAVLERLGQLRARGTGVLSRKAMTDQQRNGIGALLGELEGLQRYQSINLDKVMTYSPHTQAKLGPAIKSFDAEIGSIVARINQDILSGALEGNPQDYFNATTALIDKGYALMAEILVPELQSALKKRIVAAERSLWAMVGLSVLVALVFAYLAMGAYISMIRGVRALGTGAERLAEGDLTGRVTLAAKDELDDVARHFNHMADSMQSLLGVVQQTAHRLGGAATDVSTSAARVMQHSVEQSDAATTMAAAVEEMTVSIDRIADHAREAQDISTQAGELSLEGRRVVSSTVDEMQKIAATVNQSSAIIEELGQHSQAISTIVNVIKEIADQTNLLALNAAIEAARAGESGRGFAVVADEVRKLAERTTASTTEISAMIGAIQSGAGNAVTSMKSGVDRVAEGVELSRSAGESIGRITEGTERVRVDIRNISDSLREQSQSSNQIARSVEDIARMSQENSSAVQETARTAGELERLARELQTEVQRFRV
jgi:methyl-accepting chemotaxis protein